MTLAVFRCKTLYHDALIELHEYKGVQSGRSAIEQDIYTFFPFPFLGVTGVPHAASHSKSLSHGSLW